MKLKAVTGITILVMKPVGKHDLASWFVHKTKSTVEQYSMVPNNANFLQYSHIQIASVHVHITIINFTYIIERLRIDLVEGTSILHTSVGVSSCGVHQVTWEIVQGKVVCGGSLSSVG